MSAFYRILGPAVLCVAAGCADRLDVSQERLREAGIRWALDYYGSEAGDTYCIELEGRDPDRSFLNSISTVDAYPASECGVDSTRYGPRLATDPNSGRNVPLLTAGLLGSDSDEVPRVGVGYWVDVGGLGGSFWSCTARRSDRWSWVVDSCENTMQY